MAFAKVSVNYNMSDWRGVGAVRIRGLNSNLSLYYAARLSGQVLTTSSLRPCSSSPPTVPHRRGPRSMMAATTIAAVILAIPAGTRR